MVDGHYRIMENIVLWVAQGLIDEELLREVVDAIISNNVLTENVKVKLASLLYKI